MDSSRRHEKSQQHRILNILSWIAVVLEPSSVHKIAYIHMYTIICTQLVSLELLEESSKHLLSVDDVLATCSMK